MQRRVFTFGFSALTAALLTGCGGGGNSGNDEPPANPAFPAWNRGGAIALGKGNIVVTFDLSQGHLLGLATMDVADPKKDDPTRHVMPTEVKEVLFASAILGGPETSPARASWETSGVITLPNTAGADKDGWFFVVLKTGEIIPLAMGPNLSKSRYSVTGGTNVLIGAKGNLSYGDFRLSRIEFPNPTTAHWAVNRDVMSGILSAFARPTDLLYAQWNCDDTGWLSQAFPRMRMPVQVDASGRAYCDFVHMPNNSQGLFTFHHRDGRVLWINLDSPLWESLGGMERVVVDAEGRENLRYGGYRKGGITRPNLDTLRVDWGVDVLHSLVVEGTETPVDVSLADIDYFQLISESLGWDASPARGVPIVLPNGDYRVDITGISATGQEPVYVKAFTKDGRKLALNPNAPRFVGSVTRPA